MEENQASSVVFFGNEGQRQWDHITLLDCKELSPQPSTSKEWIRGKWEEITSHVHNRTEIIDDDPSSEVSCCPFRKRCRRREPTPELVPNDQYVPVVQCEKDHLCRYCRIIRRQQLTDKRRQLEVVLKLYEKQLKALNQKEKELLSIHGKKPSILRRWGNMFKLSGSTDTISNISQRSDSKSKTG